MGGHIKYGPVNVAEYSVETIPDVTGGSEQVELQLKPGDDVAIFRMTLAVAAQLGKQLTKAAEPPKTDFAVRLDS